MQFRTFSTFNVVTSHPQRFIPWPRDSDIILNGRKGTQWDKNDGIIWLKKLIQHYKHHFQTATTRTAKTAVAQSIVEHILYEDRDIYFLVPFDNLPNTFVFELFLHDQNPKQVLISKIKEKLRDAIGKRAKFSHVGHTVTSTIALIPFLADECASPSMGQSLENVAFNKTPPMHHSETGNLSTILDARAADRSDTVYPSLKPSLVTVGEDVQLDPQYNPSDDTYVT